MRPPPIDRANSIKSISLLPSVSARFSSSSTSPSVVFGDTFCSASFSSAPVIVPLPSPSIELNCIRSEFVVALFPAPTSTTSSIAIGSA